MKFQALNKGFIAVLFSSLLVLSSCMKSDDDNTRPTDVSALMGFNLAVDQQNVVFKSGGTSIFNMSLGFNSFTGNYAAVYPGNRNITADNGGTGINLASTAASLDTNKYYSIFFMGANSNYRNVLVEDEFETMPDDDNSAYFRIVQAIPDSTPVNVRVNLFDAMVHHTNYSFGAVSAFMPVGQGQLQVQILDGNVEIASKLINAESKKIYTILLSGVSNPTGPAQNKQITYIVNGRRQ